MLDSEPTKLAAFKSANSRKNFVCSFIKHFDNLVGFDVVSYEALKHEASGRLQEPGPSSRTELYTVCYTSGTVALPVRIIKHITPFVSYGKYLTYIS